MYKFHFTGYKAAPDHGYFGNCPVDIIVYENDYLAAQVKAEKVLGFKIWPEKMLCVIEEIAGT